MSCSWKALPLAAEIEKSGSARESEHEALRNLLLWAGYRDRRVWAGGTDSFYAMDEGEFYSAETAQELLDMVDGQGDPK